MPQVSKQRIEKRTVNKRLHLDGHGVPFLMAGSYLPRDTARWPFKQVDDPEVCRRMHDWFLGSPCWFCGLRLPLEAHHIVPRSDELCNIAMGCHGCHVSVQDDPSQLRRVLLAKWLHDQANTDWRRLCELRMKHFDFDLAESI